jgi:peptidoglycan/xylan/chitin deacetylase (PgdA/CDA1 family)
MEHMPDTRYLGGETRHRLGLNLPGVPIFNYHGLAESVSHEVSQSIIRYWLSPTSFRSHLAHIRDEGFHAARLDELQKPGSGRVAKLSTVVLTFDDGLASDYDIAFPLLAEFGMSAVFFLNTAMIGQAGYLNWSQIAEMQRYGMSIQSHSHRHIDLTVLPNPALDSELNESKRLLEDRLGSQVDFLAAPRGILDRRVVRRALALGYRAVCSTRCLPARPGSTIFTRITLHRGVTTKEFRGFLKGEVWPYARRLSRGLFLHPIVIPGHLCQVVRHRWLKWPATPST